MSHHFSSPNFIVLHLTHAAATTPSAPPSALDPRDSHKREFCACLTLLPRPYSRDGACPATAAPVPTRLLRHPSFVLIAPSIPHPSRPPNQLRAPLRAPNALQLTPALDTTITQPPANWLLTAVGPATQPTTTSRAPNYPLPASSSLWPTVPYLLPLRLACCQLRRRFDLCLTG
jgi:hypothetical protein